MAASGQMERTLIVFTSDHGDMDAAHRLEHKSTLYDEACRIPLIVCPPGGMAGRVDQSHLVSNGLDLLPTFCDWAGVSAPSGLAGRSLRSWVEGGTAPAWRTAVPVEFANGRGLVTERFKYARYDVGCRREQLVDLFADPGELRNRIDDPELAGDVAALRADFTAVFGDAPRDEATVMKSMTGA